jgi:hypothetical protein
MVMGADLEQLPAPRDMIPAGPPRGRASFNVNMPSPNRVGAKLRLDEPMAKKSTKPLRPSEHNLTDFPDYVQAIGMISLETVDTELRLANLFSRMIGVPLKVGQAIYLSPKAEQTRFDIFRNAAQARLGVPKANLRMKDALKKIESILERSEKLIRKRHRVIHDDWGVSSKEKKVTRRLLDGGTGRERTQVDKTELDNHIYALRCLIDDIYDLTEAFREHPPFMVDMQLSATREG